MGTGAGWNSVDHRRHHHGCAAGPRRRHRRSTQVEKADPCHRVGRTRVGSSFAQCDCCPLVGLHVSSADRRSGAISGTDTRSSHHGNCGRHFLRSPVWKKSVLQFSRKCHLCASDRGGKSPFRESGHLHYRRGAHHSYGARYPRDQEQGHRL